MGITVLHAELIIREHKFRPLPKTVHLLGRQTVHMTYQQAVAIVQAHGISPAHVIVQIDQSTLNAIATEQAFITDTTFFGMLGVEKVLAIDHSDFEGAEIILDLNEPIPADVAGTAEFLFGGSVLDNVFDPAMYIRNITRLLSVGGRLIDQNIGSFHFHPYVVTSPAWYFDYFVLNAFSDCKLYLTIGGHVTHLFGLEFDSDDTFISDFGSAGTGIGFGIIIIVEKGKNSSSDKMPSQDQYRGPDEWESYRANMRRMKESPRILEVFGSPSPLDMARQPLRWNRSFRYLGVFRGAARDFDGEIPQPQRTGIKIIEASYGLSLIGKPLIRPGIVPLCIGNVTDQLSEIVNGQDQVEIVIDVARLGDPAPDLGKDFKVSYIYMHEKIHVIHEIYIPAEAHGQTLTFPPLS